MKKLLTLKTASLRVPGTSTCQVLVIDVQVFTRDGVEKDARAKDIEEMQLKLFALRKI